MKYYSIKGSNDLKEIGFYPQTEVWKKKPSNFTYNFYEVNYNSFPDFIPNLELELNSKAEATDYLNAFSISFGFVVSDKLRNILKGSKLPPHAFYPIKVHHNNKILNYFWFHYIINIWDFIDKEKSYVEIFNKFKFIKEDVVCLSSIDNLDDYNKEIAEDKELLLNKISFKKNYPSYDILEIRNIGYSGDLISDALLNRLKEEKITGFDSKHFKAIM